MTLSELELEVAPESTTLDSVDSNHLNPLVQKIFQADAMLEQCFNEKIRLYPTLTRKIVSFQANKSKPEYRWFKYKEAFSAELVQYLLFQYEQKAVKKILDPFAGAGTALFACSESGIKADGIELLPIGQEIINVRKVIQKEFNQEEFSRLIFWKEQKPWNQHNQQKPLNHLRITKGAYPSDTEESIERFLFSLEQENLAVQKVLRFALLCILESVSYTRKDGQYLRWDKRAFRKGSSDKFDKGEILAFDEAIINQLELILNDTLYVKNSSLFPTQIENSDINLFGGSCLELLPEIAQDSYDGIITSPPYCNRYDYTRTYALELALLGVGEKEIVQLRQDMLSCTVENKEKALIKNCQRAVIATDNQELLQKIIKFLYQELERKKLNNNGIPRMVRGYFYEMACVIVECFRVLRTGAPLFMVNDNVRYAGVDISVDLILSDIANKIGFDVEAILVLPTGKGNSSQQMGVHGRKPLRKCVYVWRKP